METLLFILSIVSLLGGVALALTSKEGFAKSFSFTRAAAGVLGFVLLLAGSFSFTTVDAGSVGIVKRFGNPVRVLTPGLHFVRPIGDTVTTVAVQTRVVKPKENAVSHDLQAVNVEVTLAYHIDALYADFVLVTLNNDAEERVINPAILESIKAITAKYDVKELVAQRPKVRDDIEEMVKARIAPYHIVAETTSITNFSFSQEYEASIERKVVAEQNYEKSKNDLDRIKVEAEQKVAQANGEAAALKAQKEQITPELLQLRTIEMMDKKWDGHLPESIVGGNSALPMMDVLTSHRSKVSKE